MIKKQIYCTGRGQGKTKWLVEQMAKEYENGVPCYYAGSEMSFSHIQLMWENIFHKKCPIKLLRREASFERNSAYFTDNFFQQMQYWHDVVNNDIKGYGGIWYITVDREDFVNV